MLESLVLSVTYRCPIQCRYCGVHASPYRRESMSLSFIKRMVDEAHSLGTVRVVVFTGGEPFLLGKGLFSAVEYAATKGLLTRIVTNAYWATSMERALDLLTEMKNIGLTELNYSCDDFHQEFIPLERVRWANEAALKVGIPALIAVKGLKNSRITPEHLDKYFGTRLARFKKGQKNPTNNVLSFGITVPVGWECEQLTDDDLLWGENDSAWKYHCTSVLQNIVITPMHRVAICCGIGSDEIPETIVGDLDIKPLMQIISEANDDLVVNWLALEGPYGIMRFIQKKVPSVNFHNRYVNTCHLCHDIFTRDEARKALRGHLKEAAIVLSLKRAFLEIHRNELSQLDSECERKSTLN